MRVTIEFDYVNGLWEIWWREENRSICATGKTLADALNALKDTQVRSQIILWLQIGDLS